MGSGGGTTEHMVVHGELGQGEFGMLFVPNDVQPTFSEAVEAFESGIPVILVAPFDEARISSRVLFHAMGDRVARLYAFFVDGYAFWERGENTDSEPDPSPDPGPNPIQ